MANDEKSKIYLNLPSGLIQTIRLTQALMESDFDVCIKEEDVNKYMELRKIFGIKYIQESTNCRNVSFVSLSHDKPLTTIGSIERPLIFPHGIVKYCKTIWNDKREVRCSFTGLITTKRKSILDSYIKKNYPNLEFNLAITNSFYAKLRMRLMRLLKIKEKSKQTRFNDILIWSSNRGRKFPIKAWDEEYYKVLSNSEFVLCPNGDFIWTYRFYEAILCGAIPIIESKCSNYNDFRYRTMEEPLNELVWSREDAEYNYNLCVQRLTVPLEILNSELSTILDHSK